MNGILTDLSEPRWWFSVFFVAIIASVLAGFLKDGIGRWLSRTWSWYRTRRKAPSARREQHIQILCDNTALLTVATVHAAISLIWFVFFFFSFMFMPVWTDLMYASPSFASWVGMSRSAWVPLAKSLIILAGVGSIFNGARMASGLSLAFKAHRRLWMDLTSKKPPNMALIPTVGHGRPPAR
jgi:hypothetical protein